MEYYIRMKTNRVYFPPTTPQQRKLLFESWEQSGNVTAACRRAHVGRATFYYWKSRFAENGYAGLETYEKAGVPKGTGRVAVEIQAKVTELHGEHADWGKRRLADEMAKANNWVPLVSPNAVRRILAEAGMWKPEENCISHGKVKQCRLHKREPFGEFVGRQARAGQSLMRTVIVLEQKQAQKFQ